MPGRQVARWRFASQWYGTCSTLLLAGRSASHPRWHLNPLRRQNAAQLLGGPPRVAQEHAGHFAEDEAVQVVAGPAGGGEVGGDLLQAALAELVYLAGDGALVDAQQFGHLALAQAVAPAQAQDQGLGVGDGGQPGAGGVA